ncbi:TPA: restriction endonuclease subunit S [Streptococcus suis]|nr:restriction endonuclease subunit S [Streptococcus suis]
MGSDPTPPAKRRRRHKKALSPRLAKLDKEFEEVGGEWREVELGNIFKIYSPSKRFNANNLTFDGVFPYVARGDKNNGIRGYIDEDTRYLSPANSISFGQDTATMFYQKSAYFTGDKIKIFEMNEEGFNQRTAQFIISAMRKSFANFSWGSSSYNENILKTTKTSLPYHGDKIAFSYMENYIKTLEAERIETLEAYLTVTGLKEYHLTKNDEKILDTFTKLTDAESRVEYLGILWEKFPVASLFDIQTSRSVDKGALDLSDEPKKYPFIGRTSQNNGVQGYLDYLGFAPNPKNTFSVIQIGENVAQFRNKEWYGSQNLFVLHPYTEKIIDANLFFTTCLNMSLLQFSSGYTNYPTLSKLKELELVLPVKEQQIDYTFMSDFIKVIEKLVIKDLVEWTDKKIQATKEVVRYGE